MVRKLSLLVAVSALFMALAGASSALAAPGAACVVNTATCPSGSAYSGYFGAALNGAAGPSVLTTPLGNISCNKSDGYGAITTNRQPDPDNIRGYLYNISFSQNGGRCPSTISALGNPWATVAVNDTNGSGRGKWVVGAHVNATGTGGTMTFYNPSVTITLWNAQSGGAPVAQCTYTGDSLTGTITNSNRQLKFQDAPLSSSSPGCPTSGTYTASFTTFGTDTHASGGSHIPIYVTK